MALSRAKSHHGIHFGKKLFFLYMYSIKQNTRAVLRWARQSFGGKLSSRIMGGGGGGGWHGTLAVAQYSHNTDTNYWGRIDMGTP